MIYNTKDLVLRARQLADLENSDFISYNENVQLLNETYQKVYQKLINSGDKAYLKTIIEPKVDEVNDLPEGAIAYILPPDFYQLQSVTYGKFRYPILRKAKTQSPLSLCYDIVNDELIIYRSQGVMDIQINYYPTPCALYLAAPQQETSFSLDNTVGEVLCDCRYKQALTQDPTNHYFYLYDFTTESKATVDYSSRTWMLNAQFESFILSPSSILVVGKGDVLSSRVELYDLITGTWETLVTGLHTLHLIAPEGTYLLSYPLNPDSSGQLYEDCTLDFINPQGTGMQTIGTYDLPVGLFDNLLTCNGAYLKGDIYLIHSRWHVPGHEDVSTWIIRYPFGPLNMEDLGNALYPYYPLPPYYNTAVNGVLSVNEAGDLYYRDAQGLKINGNLMPVPSVVRGVLSTDFDTGYGFLLQDKYGWHITSCFIDTQLDFPQNFYYTYLAYSLALSYGIKQQKDVSVLSAKVAEIEDTFYDTLERDDNAPLRINNVYRR